MSRVRSLPPRYSCTQYAPKTAIADHIKVSYALAADLTAWLQRLTTTDWAATAEPKRLRLRIFTVAGHLVHTARQQFLKIPQTWPWADIITTAHHNLTTLAST
jgi:Transposase DDE domain group 1